MEIWKHDKEYVTYLWATIPAYILLLLANLYTLFYCNTSGGLFLQSYFTTLCFRWNFHSFLLLVMQSHRTTLNGKWSRIVTIIRPCCRRISPPESRTTVLELLYLLHLLRTSSWHAAAWAEEVEEKESKQSSRQERTKAGIIFIVPVLSFLLNFVVSLNFPFPHFLYYTLFYFCIKQTWNGDDFHSHFPFLNVHNIQVCFLAMRPWFVLNS